MPCSGYWCHATLNSPLPSFVKPFEHCWLSPQAWITGSPLFSRRAGPSRPQALASNAAELSCLRTGSDLSGRDLWRPLACLLFQTQLLILHPPPTPSPVKAGGTRSSCWLEGVTFPHPNAMSLWTVERLGWVPFFFFFFKRETDRESLGNFGGEPARPRLGLGPVGARERARGSCGQRRVNGSPRVSEPRGALPGTKTRKNLRPFSVIPELGVGLFPFWERAGRDAFRTRERTLTGPCVQRKGFDPFSLH